MTELKKIEDSYRKLNLNSSSGSSTHASTFMIITSEIRKKFSLLEIGSGTGHVSMVIKDIYNDVNVSGIEVQKDLYEISEKNTLLNSLDVSFINKNISDYKNIFPAESFDYIISNPPHYTKGKRSTDPERDTARFFSEDDLAVFLKASYYLLKNKRMCNFVIHPSILSILINNGFKYKLIPQIIIPAYGKISGEAQLLSVQMRKNGGDNLIMKSPYLL